MGRISAVISDELEEQLRSKARKKGDIARIVEAALQAYFNISDRFADLKKKRSDQ